MKRSGLKHACSRYLIHVAELQDLHLRGKEGQQVQGKSLNERVNIKKHEQEKGDTEKVSNLNWRKI